MIAETEIRHVSGWISSDADGTVVSAGALGERLLGWDVEALQGNRLDLLVHPDDRGLFDATAARVRPGTVEQVVQLRMRSNLGRWLRVEATLRGVGSGLVVADLVDISARFVRTEGLALLAEIRGAMDAAPDLEGAWSAALDRLAERGGFGHAARWVPRDAETDRPSRHQALDDARAGAQDDALDDAQDDGQGDALDDAPDDRQGDARDDGQDGARGDTGDGDWVRQPLDAADPDLRAAVDEVARTGRWGWTHDLVENATVPTRTAVLVPVRSSDRLVAIIELSRQHRLVDESAIAMIVEVAGQLGDGIERRRVDHELALERQRFQLAFEETGVGMMLVGMDGRVLRANQASCTFFARPEPELCELDLRAITHPDDIDRDRDRLRAVISGDLRHCQLEKRFVRPDGSSVWGLATVSLVRDDDGRPLQFVAQIEDISARRSAQQALERTVALFAAAFDGAATGMVLVGLDGDEQSVIAASNARFRALCRRVGKDQSLQRFDEFSPGADRWLQQVGMEAQIDSAVCERAVDGPDEERWVRLSAAPVNTGDADHRFVLVHVEDITEQRQAQSELAYNALHDTLTGLPNRALISERIRHAQERSERTGAHVGVLFIDLDHFKDVNDSLGHHAGDELLREVARRFAATIRPADTAARLGGDEFVILCEDLDPDPAVALGQLSDVARRLHRSLEGGVEFDDGEGWVTASIGLQVVRGASQSVSTVLGNADVAMYRAKANGRSRTEVFDSAMRRAALERVHIAGELRRALDRSQMWCEYQPIVRLSDATVVGAEALLRWHHPDLGLVAPSRFIDVAEESDLIVEIGEFVVDAVCRTAAALPQLGYITMNLSARQLAHSRFSALLLEAIEQHGVDPGRIAVELTENVLMDAGGSSLRQLVELRDAGIPIGVDDFGTGFASLTYLRRLPVSFVKIDKSFVDGILHDPDDRTIVDGTIGLAHSLGLALVAEGVEQVEQAELLDALGCECGQGYLFSRPTAAVEALVASRPTAGPNVHPLDLTPFG